MTAEHADAIRALPRVVEATEAGPRHITLTLKQEHAGDMLEARAAPKRPADFAISTFATAVPSAPNASIDRKGHNDHRAAISSGSPRGAVNISANACALQITGTAPY